MPVPSPALPPGLPSLAQLAEASRPGTAAGLDLSATGTARDGGDREGGDRSAREKVFEHKCAKLRVQVKELQMEVEDLQERLRAQAGARELAAAGREGPGALAEAEAAPSAATAAARARWEEGKKLQRKLEVARGKLEQCLEKQRAAEVDAERHRDRAEKLEGTVQALMAQADAATRRAREAEAGGKLRRQVRRRLSSRRALCGSMSVSTARALHRCCSLSVAVGSGARRVLPTGGGGGFAA